MNRMLMKKLVFFYFILFLVCFISSLYSQNVKKSKKEYLTEIFTLLEDNKIDRAIKLNNEMIKKYPTSMKALGMMSCCYSYKKNYSEAKRYAIKIFSLKTNNPTLEELENLSQAHQMLATISMAEKNYDNAIFELKFALELDPNNDGILLQISSCYSFNGDFDNAIKAYEKIIQMGKNCKSKGYFIESAEKGIKILKKIKQRK